MSATQTPARTFMDLTALPAGQTCEQCFHFARKCAADFDVDPRATTCEFIPAAFTPRLPGKAAD